jgi:glutamyl-tRNA reductase
MTPLIVAFGVNHKTAPVKLREKFACPLRENENFELSYLSSLPGVEELAILSTCNRVEVYAVVRDRESAERLFKEFLKLKNASEEEGKYFFFKEGPEAVRHILSIPAGLSSMVLGETQITKQFKEAYLLAKEKGTIGEVLSRLFDAALRTAKRVRTETELSKTPVSVSYIAVALAKKVFGPLEGVKVLLLGAGEMGELTARYLKRERAKIFVANRTLSRATKLAEEIGGGVVEWENFKDFLKQTDIVIVSTGAPSFVITAEDIKRVMKRRPTPLVLIDISVPRNVDPSVAEFPNVFLYNIDDLKEIAEKNLLTRSDEAKKGWLIVEEETEKFFKFLQTLKVKRLLSDLRSAVEVLKRETLRESPSAEEALDRFSKRLLHPLYGIIKENPSLGEEFLKNLRGLVEKLTQRGELMEKEERGQ